jgi:hypothetical protein
MVLILALIVLILICMCAWGGDSGCPKTDLTDKDIKYILEVCTERFTEDDEVKETYVRYATEAMKSKEYLSPRWYLEDIPSGLVWDKRIPKLGHHHGQKKLFLNEIQFLSNLTYEPDVVIYAGAAEGNKNYLIWRMFRRFKYVLIDPAPFRIFLDSGKPHYDEKNDDMVYLCFGTFGRFRKSDDNPKDYAHINMFDYTTGEVFTGDMERVKKISAGFASDLGKYIDVVEKFVLESKYKMFIINGYLTSDMSKHLGVFNSCFISDIRTAISGELGNNVGEGDIVWNSVQTVNWLNNMKPKESMLKLRLPWSSDSIMEAVDKFVELPYVKSDIDECREMWGIDFVENLRKNTYIYFDGDILVQPFAPKGSTETRLVVKMEDGVFAYKDLSGIGYDKKLQYFNAIERSFSVFENPNADFSLGFDYCADCSLENLIFEKYVEKYGGNVRDLVVDINTYVPKSKNKYHGRFCGVDKKIIKDVYAQGLSHNT